MAPQVTLHAFDTPHTKKVSVLLEELGLDYELKKVDLLAGEQQTAEYKAINVIGKVPAIVDHTPEGDVAVSDSNAILFYLADKYDKDNKLTFAAGTPEFYEYVQWLITTTELGTIAAAATFLQKRLPEKQPAAVEFAKTRSTGLFKAYDTRLAQQAEKYSTSTPYLVGNKYTAADIATYATILLGEIGAELDLSEFKNLQEFKARIAERENVKAGYAKVVAL
ncbi:glutathione S-transferase [Ascobolus immersus RN42]|uniref:Glutathione S-transferase n=1 Tax=Ascobolus immersus RN42 TaxID=1160509 RepID=A0A3N4IB79_ASCIM|nr:glutathione S-transferase [Ascobolus immersus RN42]